MNNEFLDKLKKTLKSYGENDFTNFLFERLKNPSTYRGIHITQHNRVSFEECINMLNCIYDVVGEGYLKIPIQKNRNSKIEGMNKNFSNFWIKFRTQTKKGTVMTIRKNYCPDFSRQGIFDKFFFNKETNEFNKVDPLKKKPFTHIRLTRESVNLIKEKNYKKRKKIYNSILEEYVSNSSFIIKNTNDLTSHLYEILITNNKEISYYEFHYIWTHSNVTPIKILWKAAKSFRKIADSLINDLNKSLEELLNPNNWKDENGRKIVSQNNMYDWGNWNNGTMQIIHEYEKLSKISYDSYNKKINLSYENKKDDNTIFSLNRKEKIKSEYFKKHGFKKNKEGYELHHVIPFHWAKDVEEYKMIENWKNLLYIDGKTHASFSQNGNRYVILKEYVDGFLKLETINGEELLLKNNEKIIVNDKIINTIIEWNNKIIEKYK